MSQLKLGTVPTGNEGRDAVHVAILPAKAGENLLPGKHVRIDANGLAVGDGESIGIVDPFGESVSIGKWFWLCIYPNSITGLRHHWSTPSLDHTNEIEWITTFAAKWKYSFTEFMNAAREFITHGTYLDDKWEQLEIPDEDWDIFWTYFRTVTGLSLENKEKGFVTCCAENQ